MCNSNLIRQKEEDASSPHTSSCAQHMQQGTCSFLLLCWGWVKQGGFTTPWRWLLLTPWLQTEAGGEGRLDFWKGLKELCSFSECFWGIAISKLAMLVTLVSKSPSRVYIPSVWVEAQTGRWVKWIPTWWSWKSCTALLYSNLTPWRLSLLLLLEIVILWAIISFSLLSLPWQSSLEMLCSLPCLARTLQPWT